MTRLAASLTLGDAAVPVCDGTATLGSLGIRAGATLRVSAGGRAALKDVQRRLCSEVEEEEEDEGLAGFAGTALEGNWAR